MFSGGWKDIWLVLYDNSDLCMYNRQGDLEIKAKIHMKVSVFPLQRLVDVGCLLNLYNLRKLV